MTETPTWLDEAIRRKDELSLRELSEHLGVDIAELSRVFRAHGVRRRIHTASEAAANPPPDARVRPNSKDAQVETYRTLLGKVPDAEVARLADVSVRTIASYRARHDIPGYDGPRRRKPTGGTKDSQVEDYQDLLGQVPDRVVADLAGMSLGAVRNYRIKHDIPAAGRMPPSTIQARLASWRRSRMGRGEPDPIETTPGSLPPSIVPTPVTPSTPPSTTVHAWRYLLRGASTPRVVLASDIEAALAKVARLAGSEDHIESVEDVGRLLQGVRAPD